MAIFPRMLDIAKSISLDCCNGSEPVIVDSPLQTTLHITSGPSSVRDCFTFSAVFNSPNDYDHFLARNGSLQCTDPLPLSPVAMASTGGNHSFRIFLYLAIIPLSFGAVAVVAAIIFKLCFCYDARLNNPSPTDEELNSWPPVRRRSLRSRFAWGRRMSEDDEMAHHAPSYYQRYKQRQANRRHPRQGDTRGHNLPQAVPSAPLRNSPPGGRSEEPPPPYDVPPPPYESVSGGRAPQTRAMQAGVPAAMAADDGRAEGQPML